AAGANENQAPILLLDKYRPCSFGDVENSVSVDLHRPVEILEGGLGKNLRGVDSRIEHNTMKRAEGIHRGLHYLRGLLPLRDIVNTHHGLTAGGYNLVDRLLHCRGDVIRNYVGAETGKKPGMHDAHAVRRPGDDHGLTL